jgi:hypothetical protein
MADATMFVAVPVSSTSAGIAVDQAMNVWRPIAAMKASTRTRSQNTMKSNTVTLSHESIDFETIETPQKGSRVFKRLLPTITQGTNASNTSLCLTYS